MAQKVRKIPWQATRRATWLMVLAAFTLAIAACGEVDDGPAAAPGTDDVADEETSAPDPEVEDGDDEEVEDGDDEDEVAQEREPSEMTVASWGGKADEVFQEVFAPFEEEFNVTIEWVVGNSVENVARVAATRDNPEFDVALKENTNQATGSEQGLWAELDPDIVTHADDIYDPQATAPNNDGVGFGFIATGLFYKTDEFEENGWDPPTSWDDLFRPELCGRVGMLHPNVTYSLLGAMMLGGGELENIEAGFERMSELADCIPTFEPSSPALEEKVQLGEYLIGVHGSFRIMPLTEDGYPVQFVYPEEGAALMLSMASPVEGAPNPEMAQEFVNWFIRPESQQILMEELYYGPTNSTVEVPSDLVELGVPDVNAVDQMARPDELVVVENRRAWTDLFDRMMQ